MKQQKIDQTTIKSTNRSQLSILLPVDHYLQVAASSHSLRKYFILTLLPLLQVERNFFFLWKEQILIFFLLSKGGGQIWTKSSVDKLQEEVLHAEVEVSLLGAPVTKPDHPLIPSHPVSIVVPTYVADDPMEPAVIEKRDLGQR